MVKIKDLFNFKTNSRNNQVSLDLRKKVLKDNDLNIKDILDLEIKGERSKWQH